MPKLLSTLCVLANAYSLLAVAIVIMSIYLKKRYGVDGITAIINHKFAGSRKALVFEICSYAAIAIWVAMALPWVDSRMFRLFSSFEDNGFRTYFGLLDSPATHKYFILTFLNIVSVKAALKLTTLAGMLRKGQVYMIEAGWINEWHAVPQRFQPTTFQR